MSAGAFVIVGGGQAGAWVARSLRGEGFSGPIVLFGEERHWPYERPPLSKSVLLGSGAEDEGVLLTPAQADQLGIQVRLGQRVAAIDRGAHHLVCADGTRQDYEKLFLTTGSTPRLLPAATGGDPGKLHYLRTRDDARRLRAILIPGRHLAVLGGGWIGLEVAASARKLGLCVTVIETAERVCLRSVPPVVSAYLEALHASQGITILTGRTLQAMAQHGDTNVLRLSCGSEIQCDDVLIGIGVRPNSELAQACGLEVDNGIVVDAAGRTSDPDIFAAGDVTAHISRFAGHRVRLESWANAQAQAIVAAQAALDKPARYDEVPWLWSDQFEANIQIVGFPGQAVSVRRQGTPDSGKGCWLMLDAAMAAVGAVAINAPRELRSVRKAMQAGTAIDLAAWQEA